VRSAAVSLVPCAWFDGDSSLQLDVKFLGEIEDVQERLEVRALAVVFLLFRQIGSPPSSPLDILVCL